MTVTDSTTLYDKVVEVTRDYLGPAADRFLTRQINTHLDKEPHQLTTGDLQKLIDWIKLATAVLTEDRQLIDDFERRLRKLAKAV